MDKTQKEKIREKWLDLFRNGLPTTLTFSATGITTLHPDFIRELDLTIKETEERLVKIIKSKGIFVGENRYLNNYINEIINTIRNK